MHTHDRTYLASLGFADSDKKSGRHDLIVRYLCQTDVALKLVEKLGFIADRSSCRFRYQQEVPLTKGEGKYQTVVGFLDATFALRATRNSESLMPIIHIEVKSQKVSTNDVIRQINLYRQFSGAAGDRGYTPEGDRVTSAVWVLVCGYPLTEGDRKLLENERIAVFVVGKHFEDWAAEQDALVATVDEL